MLLMPPRHGKSELASRMFPAFHLGHHPDHEIIACSYNVSLAMSFSRKVKEVLHDPTYQSVFSTRLHPDFQANEEWGIASGRGGYVAAGVGGGITGKGAHVLIIDDPIKNAEEADSADVREKLWDWYGSTAYTRLAPGGGVLVIQCMTGDTPVMMEDKTERRLDTLAPGDAIATYASGVLATSRVRAIRSNGSDSILKITTSSGKIVRANQRHPFLTVLPDGGVTWTRAKHLTTAHKIVALKASGENGRELPALRKGAKNLPDVADYAPATTTKRSGPTGIDHPASTQFHAEALTSNTATGSPPKTTTGFSSSSEGYAPCAAGPLTIAPSTGRTSSPSITATTQARSEDCSATTATQGSDTLPMSQWHLPPRGISDFTLDEVISIEADGVEEVFDLQVEHTENFIANGLVSHNTWWHDDDLAGRLQTSMKADPESDQFEVIKYPALAEDDEYLDLRTDLIVGSEVLASIEEPLERTALLATGVCRWARRLRLKGEALHPARYDEPKLHRIKKTIQPRHWSALFQQNPVPDEGVYFTRDQFRRMPAPPGKRCNVYIAWDFAITEKKQSDYTVGVVGLQDENDIIHVAEVLRFRSQDALYIVNTILSLYQRWDFGNTVIGFEDGQIYKTMSSLLKKRMAEMKVYPSVKVLVPVSDKMARARPLQGRMQQGMVSFDDKGEWFDTVRSELLRFPAGVHDDCVDALAWLAQLIIGQSPPARAKPPKTESWRDRLRVGSREAVGHMAA